MPVANKINYKGELYDIEDADAQSKIDVLYDDSLQIKRLGNLLYPVGSIYFTTKDSVDPASIFGGTWEKLSGGRYIITQGTGTDGNGDTVTVDAGATGGNYNTALEVENLPSHTHGKGTMRIQGQMQMGLTYNSARINPFNDGDVQVSGAFTKIQGSYFPNLSGGGILTYPSVYGFNFDTNNTNAWTGETSAVGSGTKFSNTPPYICLIAWGRLTLAS